MTPLIRAMRLSSYLAVNAGRGRLPWPHQLGKMPLSSYSAADSDLEQPS